MSTSSLPDRARSAVRSLSVFPEWARHVPAYTSTVLPTATAADEEISGPGPHGQAAPATDRSPGAAAVPIARCAAWPLR